MSLPPVTETTPLGEATTLWRRDRSAVRPLPLLLTSGRRPAHVPTTSLSVMPVNFMAFKQVVDVLTGDRRVVDGAVVVGVGGADVGELAPRHDEHRALVLGDRDDDGDVVADLAPRHGDVDALGRTDRVGVRALVERADLVGPHAGGVDDGLAADLDVLTVGPDGGAADLAVGVLGDAGEGGAVDRHGTELDGGGAGDGEAEPGVVDGGVVVQVRRRDLVGRQRGHVRQRLVGRQALVELADAGAAGEVVHPHRQCRAPGPASC